jgi:predicted transposase YbfD/YdcC
METSISLFFKEIEDPRIERRKLYPLEEILLVGLCCLLCGGEGYEDMKLFGTSRLGFLRRLYPFSNGIASADTYRRVFLLLDTPQFADCFVRWIESLYGRASGVVAIDGKSARGSQGERQSPVHMVSAWCHERGVVMGQVATEEKSNEIEAIPRLLKLLDLEGCVVTLDAMGCQRDIAEAIVETKADYVIALKGNQSGLHQDVKDFFEGHRADDFKEAVFERQSASKKSHGRDETRRCLVSEDLDGALLKRQLKWKGLRSVVELTYTRLEAGQSQEETRYYISSLPAHAETLANAIRAHWSIENQLHWSLDVTFAEDRSRIRKGASPQNISIMRHCAISLLKSDPDPKISMRRKLKKAAWDDGYLNRVISGAF